MGRRIRQAGLIGAGFIAGVLISLQIPANAEKDTRAETRAGLPVEELRSFAEVFNAIKQGYVEPVEDNKLITNAISGMLSNLDPHSAYLDVDAFKDLQAGTQGEFGGLGIEVGMEDGFVKVISPIEDTPAYRAGMKAGDFIVKIDDTPVKGITLSDAVKKMRGKPKTEIRLTVLRKGEAKPLEITLMREVIKVQSVKSKLLEAGYGYVRITQFQDNTGPDLVKRLNELYKENRLKGLVLDLRNDPGGLLDGAVGVSAAFLPVNALVVSTKGRTPDSNREFRATSEDYLRTMRDDRNDYLKGLNPEIKTVPMVVLVNSGSASASEIVAGALQDHKRALIVGTSTFGKASVQTVIPLPGHTAIKLTTARYYTPSGRSIQAKGIVPDIEVEEAPGLENPLRVREADLSHHLDNDKEPSSTNEDGANEGKAKDGVKPDSGKAKPSSPTSHNGEPAKNTSKAKPATDTQKATRPEPFEFASKNDYQLNQALNLLKGLQIMQTRTSKE